MGIEELLTLATAGHSEIEKDWMPATAVRSLIMGDPAVLWLQRFGKKNGFEPDESPYDFLSFIAGKARQFEDKWIREIAPLASIVCAQDYEVRSIGKVFETIGNLHAGVPVVAKPSLWWGSERIYGVPDLVVHTSWLADKFPKLVTAYETSTSATNFPATAAPGHYVVLDIKFTTDLDGSGKKNDFANYAAQLRIYSYLLGQLQGAMPRNAYIITRDRLFDPLAVKVISTLGQPLDQDLAELRDHFLEIISRGSSCFPWSHTLVVSNLSNDDEKWATAKNVIAEQRVPGRDPALLFQVSPSIKQELNLLGFSSLDSLLKVAPASIPFEKCKGLGPKRSKTMRAILEANTTGKPIRPDLSLLPTKRKNEFFVDFEFLTNVNVDFDKQWPLLQGCEMVFMVGVGQIADGLWTFRSFVAREENRNGEEEMFRRFIEHLDRQTEGHFTDPLDTALYHWTSAEVAQSCRASDRLALPQDHALRKLPWCDLQKPFLAGPAALPGAWGYGLKDVAKALGKLHPDIGVHWPESLQEGLRAMVMGWHAYASAAPLSSNEMAVLNTYLEIDCLGLLSVLKWLRS